MREEPDNPYIANEVPGSWDIPFRRWVLGVGLPVVLLLMGIQDIEALVCDLPIPRRRGVGIQWMKLRGAGAVWFGLAQAGIAAAMHGRFYWRYHAARWRIWETVQNIGLSLATIATICTCVLLWKTHF
jgi:hypothetical protein